MLKEYFTHLLSICVFIALATALTHPRLRRSTEFATGILLICVILLPIVDIINGFDWNFDTQQYLGDLEIESSEDVLKAAFEAGIREYLASEYQVDESLIVVLADGFDISEVKAQRIYVTLIGKASALDYKRIKSQVEREFTNNGECEVSVKFG